jgi:hypothetical protein
VLPLGDARGVSVGVIAARGGFGRRALRSGGDLEREGAKLQHLGTDSARGDHLSFLLTFADTTGLRPSICGCVTSSLSAALPAKSLLLAPWRPLVGP